AWLKNFWNFSKASCCRFIGFLIFAAGCLAQCFPALVESLGPDRITDVAPGAFASQELPAVGKAFGEIEFCSQPLQGIDHCHAQIEIRIIPAGIDDACQHAEVFSGALCGRLRIRVHSRYPRVLPLRGEQRAALESLYLSSRSVQGGAQRAL